MSTTLVGRTIRRLLGRVHIKVGPQPRCMSREVRSEVEIRAAAAQLGAASEGSAAVLPSLLRDLVALNTPALFLHIIDAGAPVHVVLRPWSERRIRMRGGGYLLEAGSAAPEGVEAFTAAPYSHVTALYPVTPDHPVYVISVEHQAERVYTAEIPPYLTHVTIMVNGSLVARCERLLHERGPQVWAAA